MAYKLDSMSDLSPRHHQWVQEYVAGVNRADIARNHGVHYKTVYMVLTSPGGREAIAHYEKLRSQAFVGEMMLRMAKVGR
jgi:hypothetical protein